MTNIVNPKTIAFATRTLGREGTAAKVERMVPVTISAGKMMMPRTVVVQRKVADLKDHMVSTETSFYVTSLTSAEAGPDRIAKIVRGHWEIENGLHLVRDVTWDEDRSQVRTDFPHSLASFRNLAIAVFRHAGETNAARGLRRASLYHFRSLALLGM